MTEKEKSVYIHEIKNILEYSGNNTGYFYARENIIFYQTPQEQTDALLEVYLYQNNLIDELRQKLNKIKLAAFEEKSDTEILNNIFEILGGK